MKKITWETIEYLHREKTADWYWIVSIVTLSIALISIILNNIIFAILIIVASFTLSLLSSQKPKIIKAEVNNIGVLINKTLYPYKELDSFWVETRDHNDRILLKSKKILMPLISVFIDDVDPEEVRELLAEHLPEEEHREPFLEKLLKYLGF